MTIYSRSNPPQGFYVYAYLRKDGTPYYIGKGKNIRAWNHLRSERFRTPLNNNQIAIIESNMTELGAFAIERRMIRWYGRKDAGTGILRNGTDGGEGGSGVIRTPEMCKAISERNKGKGTGPRPKGVGEAISRKLKGKPKSDAHKQNMPTKFKEGHVPWNKGVSCPIHVVRKLIDNTKFLYVHVSGNIEYCSKYDLRVKYNLPQANVSAMTSGRRICGGWKRYW
jgi:hypothetical protein